MKTRNDLTVVILTKDEEKNIAAVIRNSAQVAEKILVVDSGSSDRTVALAQEGGAEVVFRAWDDDFSAQRNFALQHVSTPWVLYLDADERLDAELCRSVRAALERGEKKQFAFMRRIHAFGFEYRHGIFQPDEVLRLFPTEAVHWENKVHERPVCALPQEKLPGFAEHYTYTSWQQWWEKAGRYTSIWAEDKFSHGKRASLAACFAHASYGFARAYFVQLGFLDGWGGLYSSLQHFIYTLMKYLKLHELGRKNEGA